MGLPVVLGVVGILLFVCFIVAFVKSNSFTLTMGLFVSSLTVLACFLASLTDIQTEHRIKNCGGFVNVGSYDIDTATGLCFSSSYPIDCAKIIKILPVEVKRCIELNKQ